MKYIVYQTTNLINNKIYIGVHKTENPDIFDGYIGCGVYINTPSSYEKAKTAFQAAVKKYGTKNFRRVILNIFDNEEEAYDLEMQLVNEDFLERSDVYNMVLGGNIPYPKHIKVFRYNENGNYMAGYDSIREASKDIGVCESTLNQALRYKLRCKNSFWATDKLDKLDLSLYNTAKGKIKPVSAYTAEGVYLKSYPSSCAAARDLGVLDSSVSRSARIGYLVKGMYYFCYIKSERYDKARSIYIKNRPVYKYDVEGNFIEGYETQLDAEKANPNSNISKAIKSKKLDENNFIWGLEKLKNYNVQKKTIKSRPVVKLDDKGNIVKEWESMTACVSEVGSGVKHHLYGHYESYKGEHYRFDD